MSDDIHKSQYMYMTADAHKGQKRVADPLELELQMTVNSPLWGWKPNSDPLQQQQELLTTEPFPRHTNNLDCYDL